MDGGIPEMRIELNYNGGTHYAAWRALMNGMKTIKIDDRERKIMSVMFIEGSAVFILED
jgi:hypothetical protein